MSITPYLGLLYPVQGTFSFPTLILQIALHVLTIEPISSFIRQTLRRALGASSPIRFPASGYELISPSQTLEEELFDDYKTGRYYPVNIGEIFNSKYQVVGKLGFGTTSTVLLGRDLW